MNTLNFQCRYNSFDFTHKLKVDGIYGPKTREKFELLGNCVLPSSGIYRIHWHWTGGKYSMNWLDYRHYNYLVDDKGEIFEGQYNSKQQSKGQGASHTRLANTGAIGIALLGMYKASYSGDVCNPGKYPITSKQVKSALKLTKQLCVDHGINVSEYTVLSHAEVERTLNIKQKGKWDIRVLPGDLSKVLDAKDVGDTLRTRLKGLK